MRFVKSVLYALLFSHSVLPVFATEPLSNPSKTLPCRSLINAVGTNSPPKPATPDVNDRKIKPLEFEFAREMRRHKIRDVVPALGPPFGSADGKEDPNALNWKVGTLIKTPHGKEQVIWNDRFLIEIETTATVSADSAHVIEKCMIVGCVICQNQTTHQIWSKPFFGPRELGNPGNSSVARWTIEGWKLPVGNYRLSCVIFVQASPEARLTLGDLQSIAFSIVPSITEGEFIDRLTHFQRDSSLNAHGRARLIRREMEKVCLTDKIWSTLAAWNNATVLDFAGLCVPLEMFNSLPRFSKLEALCLRNAAFNETGLTILKDIPRLRVLEMSHVPDGPGRLSLLHGMPSLEELRVSDTVLNQADLIACGSFRNLSLLHLVGCELTEGLPGGSLSGNTRLADLSFRGANITAQDLMGLGPLPALKSLDLSQTRIQWERVKDRNFAVQLERVDLTDAEEFPGAVDVFLNHSTLKRMSVHVNSREILTIEKLEKRGVLVDRKMSSTAILPSRQEWYQSNVVEKPSKGTVSK